MRVVAYARVSTTDQADKGVSLEAQAHKLRLYAELQDLEIVACIEDAGESAKTLKRPGLQRALALLRAGEADGIVVAKLDRLTRSVRDLSILLDDYFTTYALLSVGDALDTRSAAGRLVLNVLCSVSQWEREAIAERTAAALQHMKGEGLRVGTVPYGYRVGSDGKRLDPDASEQAVIAAAKAYTDSGLSLRKIATRLAERGYYNREGRVFTPRAVQNMVA